MRPPNIPLLGLLPIVLILICLSGGSAQLIRRQHPNVVRKDNFIEAREPSDVDATGFGYGPPPPYYTGAPATSAESKILSFSVESSSQTGSLVTEAWASSETGVASSMNVSSESVALSSESSSFPSSSGPQRGTSMVSADSSAKASSATGSETASTVHSTDLVSSLTLVTTGDGASSTIESQVSGTTSDDSLSDSTSSFSGNEPSSEASTTDATDLISSTQLSWDERQQSILFQRLLNSSSNQVQLEYDNRSDNNMDDRNRGVDGALRRNSLD
ncbi:hypothetical protein NW754_015954 [Fusarium falciforme]|nr:hypothetical protein NW754_015954 [Fusarium falciforme]